ncbi:MAG: hypothetical protein NT007_15830 [Candidatus Kapabacteria bacterium]|nr:hypothetical protein [Candidatus Kapabacteria bacterium]
MSYINFFICCLFFLIQINVSSLLKANTENGTDSTSLKEIFCLNYHFDVGDTLIYSLASTDSILSMSEPALLKRRFEVIYLICDSINTKGHFFLSQSLNSFRSKESFGNQETEEITNNPWVGRKASFEIDSSGKRFLLHSSQGDAAMCPGGAFQPQLINNLGNSCNTYNTSWISEANDGLVENGLPVPVMQHSYLYRIKETAESYGYKCQKLEFIRSGQGAVSLFDGTDTTKVNVVASGSGVLALSQEFHIPISLLSIVELKISFILPDKSEKHLKHFNNSQYLLEEIKKALPKPKENKFSKIKKKIKHKHKKISSTH